MISATDKRLIGLMIEKIDRLTFVVSNHSRDNIKEDFTFEDGTSKVSNESASFVTSGSNTTVSVGIDKVDAGEESHGTFCAGMAALYLKRIQPLTR